jgi:hypothetical protein
LFLDSWGVRKLPWTIQESPLCERRNRNPSARPRLLISDNTKSNQTHTNRRIFRRKRRQRRLRTETLGVNSNLVGRDLPNTPTSVGCWNRNRVKGLSIQQEHVRRGAGLRHLQCQLHQNKWLVVRTVCNTF